MMLTDAYVTMKLCTRLTGFCKADDRIHQQHWVREGHESRWLLRDPRRRGERSQLHPLVNDLYFHRLQTFAILIPRQRSFIEIHVHIWF